MADLSDDQKAQLSAALATLRRGNRAKARRDIVAMLGHDPTDGTMSAAISGVLGIAMVATPDDLDLAQA
jgi:hypothetical protein